MTSRASQTGGATSEASGETSFTKKLICRLCLRVLPKEKLTDIFSLTDSTIQKAIRLAVSIEITRNDRSIRICQCCLDLVQLINGFRSVCERTQLLMTQNVEIPSEFWLEQSDQNVFSKCRALVEQCRKNVDRLCLDQSLVTCDDRSQDLMDETVDLVEEPTGEVTPNVTLQDGELSDELELLDVGQQDRDDDRDSVQSRHESMDDLNGTEVNDPDYEEEELLESIKQEQDHDDEELGPKIKRIKKEPDDPPERRERSALSEEMLKRRHRKPGESREPSGPTIRTKLPVQSINAFENNQQDIYADPNNDEPEDNLSEMVYETGDIEKSSLLHTIIMNQQTVMNNQSKMFETMARFQTSLDYLIGSLGNYNTPYKMMPAMEQHTPQKTPVIEQHIQSIVTPVNSVEEFDALEKSLHDSSVMQKYLKGMNFICGTGGKARGIDCCYKLIDYFVTRSFLTQCSWTGASRLSDSNAAAIAGEPSADVGKVPFKYYQKTRLLFLNLVMQADNSFSEVECEKFLKVILKNSKQRVAAKSFKSTHKNRPKNLKYKMQNTAEVRN